jgi:hypothetical protein
MNKAEKENHYEIGTFLCQDRGFREALEALREDMEMYADLDSRLYAAQLQGILDENKRVERAIEDIDFMKRKEWNLK